MSWAGLKYGRGPARCDSRIGLKSIHRNACILHQLKYTHSLQAGKILTVPPLFPQLRSSAHIRIKPSVRRVRQETCNDVGMNRAHFQPDDQSAYPTVNLHIINQSLCIHCQALYRHTDTMASICSATSVRPVFRVQAPSRPRASTQTFAIPLFANFLAGRHCSPWAVKLPISFPQSTQHRIQYAGLATLVLNARCRFKGLICCI